MAVQQQCILICATEWALSAANLFAEDVLIPKLPIATEIPRMSPRFASDPI